MKQSRKKLLIALSALLVLTIAIGGTLAYLYARTETKNNVFTFADNIRGTLTEPKWDPDKGLDLVPLKKVDKDPQITNTSVNGVTEYAAIKLTFQNGAGEDLTDAQTETLLSLIDVEWSNNWTLKDGTATATEQIYVYNKTLPQNITSDPIFYSLTVKGSVTPEQLLWLSGDYGHGTSCYAFGAHDDELCTITYRHHENCAVTAGLAESSAAGENGCDCSAAVVHQAACPSLIGKLSGTCGHDTLISGIGNFNIKVEGAVVQADAFADVDAAAADLISLF